MGKIEVSLEIVVGFGMFWELWKRYVDLKEDLEDLVEILESSKDI
jgi:hypothetical protein